MDNVNGMDGLSEAIGEAWDSGEIRGSEKSEPTGRAINDPMEAAADIALFEIAREHGHEADARRSGDVDLAAQAVETHEDYEHEMDMIRNGISEELWADPQFNQYVVDAEGDVAVAAERWDAEVTDRMAEVQAAEEAQYNEAMAYFAQAVENGEVNFYDLPEDVQYAVAEWAETEEALREIQQWEAQSAARQLSDAQQIVQLGDFVTEQGGNLDVYAFLIDQGYHMEDAATYALQAQPGQSYTFDPETAALTPSGDTFDGATNSLVHDVRRAA